VNPDNAATIDTGDVVLHGPSGERWVVAFVKGTDLSWVGWPEGWAKVSDCTLIEKASRQERLRLLRQMAAMPTEQDHRARYARAALDMEELEKRGIRA
jgi:hypothetical protein